MFLLVTNKLTWSSWATINSSLVSIYAKEMTTANEATEKMRDNGGIYAPRKRIGTTPEFVAAKNEALASLFHGFL